MRLVVQVGALFCLSVLPPPASGQLDTWLNRGDGNWADAVNWSNGVPTDLSDVFITNGYTISFSADTLVANSIILDGGSSLLFNSVFTQTLDVNQLFFGGAQNSFLRFDGNILILTNRVLIDGSGGLLGNNSGDSLYSNGTIDADIRNGSLTIQSSNFYNNGALKADGGSLFINSAAWFNTGTMSTSNGGTIYLGGTLYNGGSIFDAINSVGGTHHAILTGTLFDGQLANSNSLISQNGTLTFVKMDGGLTLTNGYRTFIGDNVTFGVGSVTTIDNGSQMVFSQSQNQTLSNGTVFFGGTADSYLRFDFRNLTLDASEFIHGSLGFIGSGTLDQLTNNGTISADVAGGPLTILSAAFTNNGVLRADNGQLTVNSKAWTNNGSMLVTGQNAALVVANALVNTGTIQVGATNTLELDGGLTQTKGSTLVDGLIKFVIRQPQFKLQGGTLSGSGIIMGDLNNSGGTLQPGDVLGVLALNGNYTQASTAKTQIALGGTQQGVTYDLLAVLNNAALAGELDVTLANGFKPYQGETFDVLLYGSRTGAYDSVVSLDNGYGYGMSYNDSIGVGSLIVLTAPAVPESSTLISLTVLMSTGGLLLRRQRRANRNMVRTEKWRSAPVCRNMSYYG
jgi:hypothetical protein